ncbi:MAG: glycosyltransferase family 39 protein [Mariprofundaceae bacterium]|nr:glycosyltransferase family 39 protein [Mariprofundaceae bacterium]
MNLSIKEENIHQLYLGLIVLALVFMFLPIHIQFIGEESVYAVYLQNMLQTGDYINAFYRPPLFLWISSGLETLFNFHSIELPLRIASILSSLCAAFFAGFFAHKVFQKKDAGIIGTLLFLTLGEIQFWYGWLGYADAMFLFFIFSSTVCLWLAAQFRKIHWYALAVILINLAFLTKSLTAYAFFFSTLFIVSYGFKSWIFFLRPINILLSIGIIIAPLFWTTMHGSGAASTSSSLIHDIAMRFTSIDIPHYLKHLAMFPIEFVARMAPISFVLIYFIIKQKPSLDSNIIRMIGAIFIINYLPYWLAPFSNMRHVVPLYAWGSLALTYFLLQYDFKVQRAAIIAITIVLLLKVPFSLWGLPFLKEKDASQDFKPAAIDILKQVSNDAIIRQSSVSFVGFALTAYINEIQSSKENIHFLNSNDHHVYIIAHDPLKGSIIIKTYTLFGGITYLLYLE